MRISAILRINWGPMLVVIGVLTASGCGDKNIFGSYVGRPPQKVDLVAERAVVRTVIRAPAGSRQGKVNLVHLDRLRYLEPGKMHDINRLVALLQEDGGLVLDTLGLEVGDTISVTTRYLGITQSGPGPGTVPNWAGYDYLEYSIAAHMLLDLSR